MNKKVTVEGRIVRTHTPGDLDKSITVLIAVENNPSNRRLLADATEAVRLESPQLGLFGDEKPEKEGE